MSKDIKYFIPAGISIDEIENMILTNQGNFGIQWYIDDSFETLDDRLWDNIDKLQGGW